MIFFGSLAGCIEVHKQLLENLFLLSEALNINFLKLDRSVPNCFLIPEVRCGLVPSPVDL